MRASKPRILFVDDEAELLASIKLTLRKGFKVDTAESGREGLQLIGQNDPYAVIVSDMRMPVMNGARFLSAARELSPDSVRLLLTGETDLDSAIMAVNNGAIFRFLKKPCEKEDLTAALTAAVEQNKLVSAEKDLLETTLRASVSLLMEVLGHMHPQAFSRSARVKTIVEHLVSCLNPPNAWALEIAGTLAHIGLVTLPPSTVEKVGVGAKLEDWESKAYIKHPKTGHSLVGAIPRLEVVGQMIERQNTVATAEETKGLPMRWDPVVLGGELIRLATEYERLVHSGSSCGEALEAVSQPGEGFSQLLTDHLTDYQLGLDAMEPVSLMLDQLSVGMVTHTEIKSLSGGILAVAGQVIDTTFLERLGNFERSSGVEQPIQVLAPSHLNSSKRSA